MKKKKFALRKICSHPSIRPLQGLHRGERFFELATHFYQKQPRLLTFNQIAGHPDGGPSGPNGGTNPEPDEGGERFSGLLLYSRAKNAGY